MKYLLAVIVLLISILLLLVVVIQPTAQSQERVVLHFDICLDFIDIDLIENGMAFEIDDVCFIDSLNTPLDRLHYDSWFVGGRMDFNLKWPGVVLVNSDKAAVLISKDQLNYRWPSSSPPGSGSSGTIRIMHFEDDDNTIRPRAAFAVVVYGIARCATHAGCRTVAVKAAKWVGELAATGMTSKLTVRPSCSRAFRYHKHI